MIEIHAYILQAAPEIAQTSGGENPYAVPVLQFKWWIIVCLLAFHGVVAAIMSELMIRSYGKWWLWIPLAFLLPLIGPLSLFVYHTVLSQSVLSARKQSFWERLLAGSPVSLLRGLQREQDQARQAEFYNFKVRKDSNGTNGTNGSTKVPAIDELILAGEYAEARALTWKMLEIARETRDNSKVAVYHDYLEFIAEKETYDSGVKIRTTPNGSSDLSRR